MDNYIGTKLIAAQPMTLGAYNKLRGWDLPKDEEANSKGYKVQYSDGYISWSPKNIFDKSYMKVTSNLGLKSNISISKEMVKDFIKETSISTVGNKTAVVTAILKNGFELVEASSCVDATNYNESVGAEMCLNKIQDRVQYLLGFLLQTAMHGI